MLYSKVKSCVILLPGIFAFLIVVFVNTAPAFARNFGNVPHLTYWFLSLAQGFVAVKTKSAGAALTFVVLMIFALGASAMMR